MIYQIIQNRIWLVNLELDDLQGFRKSFFYPLQMNTTACPFKKDQSAEGSEANSWRPMGSWSYRGNRFPGKIRRYENHE